MSDTADEYRRKTLNELVEAAVPNPLHTHRWAGAELQRRTIETLTRASEQAEQASQQLLVATRWLVRLTVVLVVLTAAIIALTIRS
jgi:hypothetical protein